MYNTSDTVLMETKLCEDIRTIRLRRNGTSPLGFAIRGGYEHGTGIYVSEVYADSNAEREGLKPGDQILRVNGFSIEQSVHDDVISLIKSATKIILKVKSVGMIPISVKDNRSEPIQWKFITDLQNKNEQNQMNSSIKSKQYKQQKNKSKCPIHSLKKEDGQIAKILLKNDATKLMPSKPSIELNSAGSSPTSSVSSKCSSSSITSSSLSSCSKLIANSCKSALSSQPKKNKLNGYYSRSLSNLTTSTADFIDGFSLTSTSTINFTRNKSTSNLNLEQLSTTPEQTASSSSTEDDRHSTLEKVKSTNKYATVYINLTNRESLGCSVVKGPSNCPGIFIQTIKANGVAEKAGLEVGDQIISINELSCLPEHMQFSEAVEKIKSNKQMKLKVKKNTAISLFLEQTVTNKLNRKSTKKTILNDLSSSSSCNESASSPVTSSIPNYSRRSSKNSFNSCNSNHLPYHMNKFSSRHNLNNTSNYYLNGQFNNLPVEKCSRSSLSGSSKRSLRKGVAHHRSYTSLLSNNNSTYGQRMNGYHSPVCLRHSSNYYSQSENDYSLYELEEGNEKKKLDLIVNDKFISRPETYGAYCKNKQFKSKSIRNLNRNSLYDCEKCNCLNYYANSDCNELEYSKKTAFNRPINSNLLKQKMLCNNLSCSNLTFKSPTDIGLSNCQQLCSMLNNQMNALQLNCLNEEVKSKSNLELNDDLIINNKLYEKMRLEKERLAIERKKLENEQLRLQEEKDKFEREKKQMETLKQHEDLNKSISSSSTISTNSAAASQSINSSTTQSSIGFLDEIKKLAERRTNENSLITSTLNKTRFNYNGQTGPAVRLLPIADGKIKHVHPEDEKQRKQHEILMAEFRAAHQKMFGSKLTNAVNSSKPIVSVSSTTTNVIAATKVTSTTTTTTTNQINSGTSSDCNESSTEINSSSRLESTTNVQTTKNGITAKATSSITVTNNNSKFINPPPPLPPTNLNNTFNNSSSVSTNNGNQDGKIRKLNTFGKLVVQTNENTTKQLPANVLPKNNLNGLNQNETVKILRTSSPNTNKKGPAPQPPCLNQITKNDKAKIVKVNKKEEKIVFLNNSNNNLYIKNHQQNQIKLEGQKNGSVVDNNGMSNGMSNGINNNQTNTNYLSTKSDISLSSLSIKVQSIPTK